MASVKAGVGREEAHETIKEHAVAAALGIRAGKPNAMIDAIAADSRIPLNQCKLEALLQRPLELTGDAHAQTQRVVNRIDAITSRSRCRGAVPTWLVFDNARDCRLEAPAFGQGP
jgi:adenylosuccinate lyase